MVSSHRSRLPWQAVLWLLVMVLLAGAGQPASVSAQAPQGSPTSSGLWLPVRAAPQELTPRSSPTAVWTGTEVIFWGGRGSNGLVANNGARYNPATDTWRPISTVNAPVLRDDVTPIWTGTEMIVYGGVGSSSPYNAGGLYNPVTDTWRPIPTVNAPENQNAYSSVWTGTEMIIWGGDGKLNWDTWETLVNTGGRYNPVTNTWTQISKLNAPAARRGHTTVWTGGTTGSGEMIVWGGMNDHDNLNTGGRYNPASDTWTATSLVDAPQPRGGFTTVWTGGTSSSGEMIVWGGDQVLGTALANGARYNPTTDTWTPVSMTNAPKARLLHTAVWTGTEMIVWGGCYWDNAGHIVRQNSGARYNPATDTWLSLTSLNVPVARYNHVAIWVDPAGRPAEMIVWGGVGPNSAYVNTGARYRFYDNFNFLPIAGK